MDWWGILLIFSASPSWALHVEPARCEFKAPPGGTGSAAFDVTNDTNENLTIEPSTKDWFVLKENKGISARDWILLADARSFKLKPGQTRHVPFRVKTPKAAQGELVGMVSFLVLKDVPSMVNLVVSVAVYVEIAGTEEVAGEISQLAVRPAGDGRVQGMIVVRNKGNVHLRPEGWMEVLDPKGAQVARIFLELGRPVYPGIERGYMGYSVPVNLPPGSYRLVAHMSWNGVKEAVKENRFRINKKGEYKLD
jgi:hypothetical protein